MLNYFLDVMGHLHSDEDGVVSFEYVIVAACIVGAVVLAFGTGAGGNISTALSTGITAVTTAFTTAIAS
jgi:pilus assembly protein Flp/PilA